MCFSYNNRKEKGWIELPGREDLLLVGLVAGVLARIEEDMEAEVGELVALLVMEGDLLEDSGDQLAVLVVLIMVCFISYLVCKR